jgi:hypothetical protein
MPEFTVFFYTQCLRQKARLDNSDLIGQVCRLYTHELQAVYACKTVTYAITQQRAAVIQGLQLTWKSRAKGLKIGEER